MAEEEEEKDDEEEEEEIEFEEDRNEGVVMKKVKNHHRGKLTLVNIEDKRMRTVTYSRRTKILKKPARFRSKNENNRIKKYTSNSENAKSKRSVKKWV